MFPLFLSGNVVKELLKALQKRFREQGKRCHMLWFLAYRFASLYIALGCIALLCTALAKEPSSGDPKNQAAQIEKIALALSNVAHLL